MWRGRGVSGVLRGARRPVPTGGRQQRAFPCPDRSHDWRGRCRRDPGCRAFAHIPIRRPTGLKLEQVVAELPGDTPLESVLGARCIGFLAPEGRGRSVATRRGRWRTSATPGFARVFWEDVPRPTSSAAVAGEIWRPMWPAPRVTSAELIGMVRDGAADAAVPEGRVSPDGAIGPIGDLLDLVARRGRPRVVLPLGIAYDPLAGSACWSRASGAPIVTPGGRAHPGGSRGPRSGEPCRSRPARWWRATWPGRAAGIGARDGMPERSPTTAARARLRGPPMVRRLRSTAGRRRGRARSRCGRSPAAAALRAMPRPDPARAQDRADAGAATSHRGPRSVATVGWRGDAAGAHTPRPQ